MKILAIGKELPGSPAREFQFLEQADAARIWELQQQGCLREIYFRQGRSETVLILECENVGQAEEILGTLPMAQAGLITYEIIPLVPYAGFSRLFGLPVEFTPRPSVYAIIRDAGHRLAVIETERGLFLPGGGCETGETLEQALEREIQEECGRRVVIGRKLGEAEERTALGQGGQLALILASFYEATLAEETSTPPEAGSRLLWLPIEEAADRLVPAVQRRALRKFFTFETDHPGRSAPAPTHSEQ